MSVKQEIEGLWNPFVEKFCHVDFLCWADYYGPHLNWLGWIVLLFGVGLLFILLLTMSGNN